MKIQNPILRGFYPDPSVCEANGKYYLCCSTFQYLPGAPVFESEDLLNWHQVSNCLTSPEQIELHQIPSSGGMFAPTIRFSDGCFYMVTNDNTHDKNFYVYTDDLNKPWSEPIYVDQGGIDPSLLFDEDGRVYFTSNGADAEGECIQQCEIDIKTGKKLSETKTIWRGNGGRFIESPHLYHVGEWYYLMIAEGGTEYGHMITYARSKNPYGPFEGYPQNPVLTNRNLGSHITLIQGIGHGDLIKDKNGNYYILCLGFRQYKRWQCFHHMGREVYMAPVVMNEDGWFTAGINGTVLEWMDVPLETEQQREGNYCFGFGMDIDEKSDKYAHPIENPHYIHIRDYIPENYKYDSGKRELSLTGTNITLNEADSPTFVGIRHSEFNIDMRVDVDGEAEEAGLSVYMDEDQHYDLYRYIDYSALPEEQVKVALRLHIGDAEAYKDEMYFSAGSKVTLHITADNDKYSFFVLVDDTDVKLGEARTKYLSSEVAGGFTGVVLGMYAINGQAKFSRFSLEQWD